jgi:adenosylcobinamide amidohydrolase
MNLRFRALASILILALAAMAAVSAQDGNVSVSNITMNNTTSNETATVNATDGAAAEQSAPATASAGAALSLDAAIKGPENLSTVNTVATTVAPISEMAGVDPLMAATASSAQVAKEPEGSFKIGEGVGGIDPFNPKHVDVEPLSLGIKTKPMRDVGKMFFVCDIV